MSLVLLLYEKAPDNLNQTMWSIQGNLSGEPVTAAILWSRKELSYCTSGFYRS